MKTTLKTSLASVLFVASFCGHGAEVNSLRGSAADAIDSAPSVHAYMGRKPGNQELLLRTFKEQPPLVPHSIEGYEEITATDNACLDCHISDEFKGKKMPRVGQSHLLKPASVNAEPALNMQRWQCNSCHVPQIDAQPLVENLFRPNARR